MRTPSDGIYHASLLPPPFLNIDGIERHTQKYGFADPNIRLHLKTCHVPSRSICEESFASRLLSTPCQTFFCGFFLVLFTSLTLRTLYRSLRIDLEICLDRFFSSYFLHTHRWNTDALQFCHPKKVPLYGVKHNPAHVSDEYRRRLESVSTLGKY